MRALIIGGGVIGNSVAWRLAREGIDVTVFERGRIGREASWAAAGMIAPQAEVHKPGPFFDLCIRARQSFENAISLIVEESGIDPEYDRPGILYVALNNTERAELEERARWQHQAGATVEELNAAEARKLEPAISPEVIYALYFPNNRRTENRLLTQAFATAASNKGANFVEGARVDAIVASNGRASGIRLDDGTVYQGDVVVNAAGSWAGQIRGLEDDRVVIYPVRGQIVCFDTRPGLIGPSIFSCRGYVVPRRDGRLLAGSTMDEAGFDKSVTLSGMSKIMHGASDMVPMLANVKFREAWAGFRPATKDLMPVIGNSPTVANVFYAAGHFRSGILLSSLTGEILADLVNGRKPALNLEPFSPARFNPVGR